MRKRLIVLVLCVFSVGANANECSWLAELFGFCAVSTTSTAGTGPGQGDPVKGG
jgi:hypothetical protein